MADGQKLPDDHAKATEAHNLLPGKADHSLKKLKAQEKEGHDRNKHTLSAAIRYGDDNSQIASWPVAPVTASSKSRKSRLKSRLYNAKTAIREGSCLFGERVFLWAVRAAPVRALGTGLKKWAGRNLPAVAVRKARPARSANRYWACVCRQSARVCRIITTGAGGNGLTLFPFQPVFSFYQV